MKFFKLLAYYLLLFSATSLSVQAQSGKSHSFYQRRLEDAEAVYFTADKFGIKADGKADVSEALQQAINQVKKTTNFGVLFIPEGKYLITKTIYVPQAVRLIGYGKSRPEIILARNSPGFQQADPADKGQAKYMFWFTAGLQLPGQPVQDANAGTFYSALSNIDLRIEDGNPVAVALRTHYAQHSFIAHVDIHTGSGKAGMFDVGNEMEDVRFFGGEYGIYTTRTSPSWQFMMVDTYFEGQRKAAIKTQEAGLTVVRMQVRNVPTVVEINPDFTEKLFMQDCQFDNVTGPALVITEESNSNNQVNLLNIDCRNVPVLASFRQSGKQIAAPGPFYKVNSFTHGWQLDELGAEAAVKTTQDVQPQKAFPKPAATDFPALPEIQTWVNIRTAGAKGDGRADDTKAIQDAINKYRTIYLPQGQYRVSETIRLKPNTVLIGLNPIATQLLLDDNTAAFAGFGSPKPLLEAPQGGSNIVSGIGLNTGGQNPRAVGCKWMAGKNSYLNDVKFVGGHGSMNKDGSGAPAYNATHSGDPNPSRKWDSQYWSLWITDGGGGTFKDIWTASSYAAAGLYISNTATQSRIYALSSEHHVRNEVKLKNVSNWSFYALQTEEEIAEGPYCQPVEIQECRNLRFANLYLFRVIWLENPYPYAVRTWNSTNIDFLNIHNFTQVKYTFDNTLFDVNTNTEVRPFELARLFVSGAAARAETQAASVVTVGAVHKLTSGFEFADAITRDSKGDIYFSDSRWRRIFKWSAQENRLTLVTDVPFKPLSLSVDAKDNLLVVAEYTPQRGGLLNGKPELYAKPDDAKGTAYGVWYNTGSTVKVYTINPEKPEESLAELQSAPMSTVHTIRAALYPGNRWRDNSDYPTITQRKATQCYVAPDGITIIPVAYDLLRGNNLLAAYPGKPFYAADEYGKRTFLFDVSPEGYLSSPKVFAERGQYSVAVDPAGNVYVADGQIYVYDKTGKQLEVIKVPERPATIVFGGQDGKTLYVTARTSLYSVQVK
jgi:sugar lactone lactonase YvrE/polygalacturonase